MTAGFARALLRWFDAHRRDLPWRRHPSPYRTLVSEFMLQQTVVATVEPYFERFVARFPELAALAAAREDEVTALWSGLGYYARARNLRRAAIAVVADHGGVLPGDEETLRTLPGIGPYTAAAVAAIAFDRRTFALDGNGIRVLARLYAVREPVNLPATREQLRDLGQSLVPDARAGDFNQAMMELGAEVCVPGQPHCGACPVRKMCATQGPGVVARKPARRRREMARTVTLRRGAVMLVQRPADASLMAGMWELPEAASPDGAKPWFTVRHSITTTDYRVAVHRGEGALPRGGRWAALDELERWPLTGLTRKVLRHVLTLI
jgi:A/G-specific adenine glycosylase